jgi:hypothetical protein
LRWSTFYHEDENDDIRKEEADMKLVLASLHSSRLDSCNQMHSFNQPSIDSNLTSSIKEITGHHAKRTRNDVV